ncbi:MAG: hypothetical protein DMD46_09745 [Gemmatimonadetes bacterium]|nr:MAG: hypothetical protein DMD46_09745 [Gemmatimonadota bacterium]
MLGPRIPRYENPSRGPWRRAGEGAQPGVGGIRAALAYRGARASEQLQRIHRRVGEVRRGVVANPRPGVAQDRAHAPGELRGAVPGRRGRKHGEGRRLERPHGVGGPRVFFHDVRDRHRGGLGLELEHNTGEASVRAVHQGPELARPAHQAEAVMESRGTVDQALRARDLQVLLRLDVRVESRRQLGGIRRAAHAAPGAGA